jgi:thymidylate kinase
LRGRLITFSGVDGAGKSTLATAVHQALRARGLRVDTDEEMRRTLPVSPSAFSASPPEGW